MASARPVSERALAVTMGDPAGIGPDITLRAWEARNALGPFAVFADIDALKARAGVLGLRVPMTTISDARGAAAVFPDALPVVHTPLEAPVNPGRPDTRNAPATIAAIERAVGAVAAGHVAGVVTNPIAKSVLKSAGFPHPGHTEYLGELARRYWPHAIGIPVMMLASPELRVVPLTIHVPLKDVPGLVNDALIRDTVRAVHVALRRDFAIPAPRIAVSGLNPHAGENGMLGSEDDEIIAPAIDALRREGIDVSGPHSADTMFHPAARAAYDAAVTMYHDQALIPIKTVSFDTGVNVTLGLPFVRTSPDHGTAFSIAGTGGASPTSFIEALRLARAIAAHRAAPVQA